MSEDERERPEFEGQLVTKGRVKPFDWTDAAAVLVLFVSALVLFL